MSKDRGSSWEEPPHVQGQGQQPRGATPCLRPGVTTERSYPMSKVRGSGLEEPPHVQEAVAVQAWEG